MTISESHSQTSNLKHLPVTGDPLILNRTSNLEKTPRAPFFRFTLLNGLSLLVILTLCLLIPGCGMQEQTAQAGEAIAAPTGQKYELKLHHLHTGESLDVVYRIGDNYLPDAMDKLNHFLRDHRTNDVSSYDPKEFDVLHEVMAKLGKTGQEIDVVCGYRTPWSNNFLRTRGGTAAPAVTGVAQHSQHMLAKAVDIRVPGVATSVLRDAALSLQAGGVGYYPVSQFVHVDVGPVRQWSFAGSGDGESPAPKSHRGV
jgi:uncharacterized protein YcbK (DUF882 family)